MVSMVRTASLKPGDAAGCAPLESFFAPKPKLGRPKGSVKKAKRGRPPNPPKVAEPAAVLALPPPTREANPPSAAAPRTDRPNATRKPRGAKVDWAAGEHLARLQQAVEDWDSKSGSYEQGMSKAAFADKMGIPQVMSFLATTPSTPCLTPRPPLDNLQVLYF